MQSCFREDHISWYIDTQCHNYENISLYFFKYNLPGGEGKVVEVLEDESAEQLSKSLLDGSDENHGIENRSFWNFFWYPSKLGKDLLTTEKFGLVQYVSHWSFPKCVHFSSKLTLMSLRYRADDPEDCLCIVSIYIGIGWCLWWWGIQVVLRVCFSYKGGIQNLVYHCLTS